MNVMFIEPLNNDWFIHFYALLCNEEKLLIINIK